MSVKRLRIREALDRARLNNELDRAKLEWRLIVATGVAFFETALALPLFFLPAAGGLLGKGLGAIFMAMDGAPNDVACEKLTSRETIDQMIGRTGSWLVILLKPGSWLVILVKPSSWLVVWTITGRFDWSLE